MLSIKTKKQFRKDLNRAISDPDKDTELLKHLIDQHLVITGTVPAKYKPHPLTGNWKPHMECHVQADFLLIWTVNLKTQQLILVRCGSHTDLF